MKHTLKPLAYMRYGDDWLCFMSTKEELLALRREATIFLENELHLHLNSKIDNTSRVYKGVSYLGVNIWPQNRRLIPSVSSRVSNKIDIRNAASYRSLVATHSKTKELKKLNWLLCDKEEIYPPTVNERSQ